MRRPWQSSLENAVDDQRPPQPTWQDQIPFCREDECQRYDGKRCDALGCRPSSICEPVVHEMGKRLDALATVLR